MFNILSVGVLIILDLITICQVTHGAATDGLSRWTAWTCDVSCGTGISFRLRGCIDPGKPCSGEKKQTKPGCSKFPCPTHDSLPSKLWKTTGRVLASMYYNFVVNTLQSVELRCNNDATRKFDRYYPRSTIHWVKNDLPLIIDPSRTVYDKGDLLIQMLTPSDTGLYQCKIEWKKNASQTIGIYALSVKSKKFQKHTKISKRFKARCNNRPLIALFGKMKIHWTHEGKEFKINKTSKKDFTLSINYIEKKHEGLWKCTVSDLKKRHWVTNRFRVFVGPEPNIIEKIISNPIYLWGIIIFTLFSSAVIVTVCSNNARRQREEADALEADENITGPMNIFLGIKAGETGKIDGAVSSAGLSTHTATVQAAGSGVMSTTDSRVSTESERVTSNERMTSASRDDQEASAQRHRENAAYDDENSTFETSDEKHPLLHGY